MAKLDYIFGIIIFLLLGYLSISGAINKEKEILSLKSRYENKLKYEQLKHKQQLESEGKQRTLLVDSINDLNSDLKTLVQLAKDKDEEILKIKGRYNKHTPNELELEMERRAQ